MVAVQDEEFHRQVSERLDLVLRWTQAIRHDLGNLVLPSEAIAEELERTCDDPRVARYIRQVRSLREQVAWARDGLGALCEARYRSEGPTDFGTWWTRFAQLLRATFDHPVEVRVDRDVDPVPLRASPGELGRLFLAVFLGLDLQRPGVTALRIGLDPSRHGKDGGEDGGKDGGKDGRVAIRITAEGGGDPAPIVPLAARAAALEVGGDIVVGNGEKPPCWTVVHLPSAAGWRE